VGCTTMKFTQGERNLTHMIASALVDKENVLSRGSNYVDIDLTKSIPKPYKQETYNLVRKINSVKDGIVDVVYEKDGKFILRVHYGRLKV